MGKDKQGQDDVEAKRAASPTRLRKASPKVEAPIARIDPERLSKAIRYLNEHRKQ
jgi:hypothetical protein